ncbi:MAG TPA: DUF6491 family protein [Sphingomicrobium sp.]|nr:DUF6491 family protein [Sphingomicrobium sp.]
MALLPMLLEAAGLGAPASPPAPPSPGTMQVHSLVTQDQIILRVPVRPPPGTFQWSERKGPRCVATNNLRAAFLSGRGHVDFLTKDRRRYRAELSDDCPALDFYDQLYLTSDDGLICAKRDSIHSRMGGTCRIERFRQLVRKRRD